MQQEVKNTVQQLREGKTILYPTDTIWGLGCDVKNTEAVDRIFEIKKRKVSKTFIILIADLEQLHDYVINIPEIAWDWVEFAEKPLTIIYEKGKNVAPNILNEDGSIAIRLVQDEFCRRVIRAHGRAIVSTSANISGEETATCFAEINESILTDVDYIVNWRQQERNMTTPSTIVRLGQHGEVNFIRK